MSTKICNDEYNFDNNNNILNELIADVSPQIKEINKKSDDLIIKSKENNETVSEYKMICDKNYKLKNKIK